jgi:hypothetical protein
VRATAASLAVAISLALSAPATAESARRAIVVCLPGLSFADVNAGAMPNLRRLADGSTVAAMNVVTRATFDPEDHRWDPEASAFLTLGVGGRGWSPRLYYADGVDLLPGAVAALREENEGGTRSVEPGYLGSALHHAGLRTAVLGCADDRSTRERGVILGAMDSSGTVGRGDVSERCLLSDPARPYGWISNLDYLLASLRRLEPDAELVLIDPGDLERAERYAPLCMPAVAAAHRRAALAQADRLVAGATEIARRRGTILAVLGPLGARQPGGRRLTLTPLVWFDPNDAPALFESGSTRRPGLVTMTDLAGALVHSLTGSDEAARDLLTRQPVGNGWARVLRLDAEIAAADRWRPGGIRTVQVLLLVAAPLALLAAWLEWKAPRRVLIAALPLVAFAGALCAAAEGPDWIALAGIALAIGAALAVRRRSGWGTGVGVLYGLLALVVLLELLPGGRALADSPLGYSLALGARYYGIGNEWMGAAVGAALAALLVGRENMPTPSLRWWPTAAAGTLLVLVLALGAPEAGANFGGALTAATACAAVAYLYAPLRWRTRALAAAAGLACFLLAAAITWDALRPPERQTHLARLLDSLHGGVSGLWPTIAAKLSVNWRVLQSLWGVLLLAELAGAGTLCWRLSRPGSPTADAAPALRAAVWAFTVASLAALAFNDSGALAAALLMAACCPALLLLSLNFAGGDRASPEDHPPGSSAR